MDDQLYEVSVKEKAAIGCASPGSSTSCPVGVAVSVHPGDNLPRVVVEQSTVAHLEPADTLQRPRASSVDEAIHRQTSFAAICNSGRSDAKGIARAATAR